MQLKTARNALATRHGETSWQVAKVDYLIAAAMGIQGSEKDAAALRTVAASRINAQLPAEHPLRQELLNGKIL
jgi:hypothetical protein